VISIDQIEIFILVFIRIAAMVFMAPLFSSQHIPMRLKAALAAVIAVLLFPWVMTFKPLPFHGLWDLAVGLSGEFALGAALGYIFSLIFSAVMLAGQVAGFQMGFGIVNVIDPMSSSELSVISVFKNLLALLIFLSINAHHWIIWIMAESFEKMPLMHFSLGGNHVEYILKLAGQMFLTSIKIAAPLIAVSLFTSVAMGLVARTVPQINVFIVGFPLQIAVGLFTFGVSLPFIISYLRGLFEGIGPEVLNFLSLS